VGGNVSLSICTDAGRVPCGFRARLTTSGGGGALFDGDGGGGVVMRVVMVVRRRDGERWRRTVGKRDNSGW
jgi:hypothetical protein